MPTLMVTPQQIDAYLRHLEDDCHRAPSTLKGYREELGLLMTRQVEITPEALAAFVTRLPDGRPLAPRTRNRRLAVVRGLVRFLLESGELTADPSVAIRRAKVPREMKVALTADDITRLVGAVLAEPPSWRRVRDGTLLFLFFYTGLRVSEAHRLNVDQVDLPSRTLRRALRKGGSLTDLVLHECLVAQLAIWLAVRPACSDPCLFPSGEETRLSIRAIQKRFAELGEAAGLKVRVHPHELRHAHATGLLREGVATAIIQQSMNHASIRTTELYLHGDIELLRGAIQRLPPVPLVPAPG